MVSANDDPRWSRIGKQSRCGGRPTTIRSLATYVPPHVLTNADLEKLVDTTDEWIMQRVGIRERHIAAPGHRRLDDDRLGPITFLVLVGGLRATGVAVPGEAECEGNRGAQQHNPRSAHP